MIQSGLSGRLAFITILAIGIVFIEAFGGVTPAHASTNRCETLFVSVKNLSAKTDQIASSRALETPRLAKQMLEHLQGRGLDLSQIQVRVVSLPRPNVLIGYKGTPVGSGELQKFPNGIHEGHIYVNDIRINLDQARHGFGTLMFLILAREAQKAGYILESGWDPTHDSRALWQSMVARGWAYHVDHFFARFHRSFLEDPATQDSIDRLVERFQFPR